MPLRIEECGHCWTAPWRPGEGDCGHRCTKDAHESGVHECACGASVLPSADEVAS